MELSFPSPILFVPRSRWVARPSPIETRWLGIKGRKMGEDSVEGRISGERVVESGRSMVGVNLVSKECGRSAKEPF